METNKFITDTIYNLGFMGTMRESCDIDGHYTFIANDDQFVFYKTADYGSLTWVKDNFQMIDLTENQYRFVNDEMLEHINRYKPTPDFLDKEQQKLWETLKKYKREYKNISANIYYGDTVLHLGTNEEFLVTHIYDVRALNRDLSYKLINREKNLHPKPMSIEQYKKIWESKYPTFFDRWKKIDKKPKETDYSYTYNINDIDFHCYMNDNNYHIITENTIYHHNCNIAQYYYDTIKKITGTIYKNDSMTYWTINKVIHSGCEYPFTYNIYPEKTSYLYNTAATFL